MSFKRSERKMSTTVQLEDLQCLRKGSVANIDPLEELVSCPIHLDLLENPRLLPCSHAFCLDCLDQCLRSLKPGENFVCPVCRFECEAPEKADGWPAAFTHSHIVDYVTSQRCKNYAKGLKSDATTPIHSSTSLPTTTSKSCTRRGSIFNKADMLKALASELASKSNQAVSTDKSLVIDELNKLLAKLTDEQNDCMPSKLMDLKAGKLVSSSSCQSSPNGRRSSYNVHCMVEEIRHNMRKYCQYTTKREKSHGLPIRQKGSIEMFPWHPSSKYSPLVDSILIEASSISVFVDDFGATYIQSNTDNRATNFNATVDGSMLYPTHVRITATYIVISGLMTKRDSNAKVGVIAKFSHEGKLLAKSREYAMLNERSPPIFGFDLDEETDEVIICKPSQNEISILDSSLAETDQYWVFDEPVLSPYYVCRNRTEREIWATCPQQKNIMILNEEDGRYSHFGADRIFGSSPSHIICTKDDRVLFLDDAQPRVFWIRKSFEYLCIQRVTLSSNMKQVPIRLLQPINSTKFLVVSDKEVYHAKALKKVSPSSKCTIL